MSPSPAPGVASGFHRDAVLTTYATSLIQFKARQLTRRRGFSRSDQEDLQQQLTLHLLNQAHHYDPARGSINTFVARVVDSCVAMILRDAKRLKRGGDVRVGSIDEPVVQTNGHASSLGALLSQDDASRRLGSAPSDEASSERAMEVRLVLDNLPPDLLDIARRLMGEGASGGDGDGGGKAAGVATIARDLGVSRRQIQNAIEKLRAHFEDAGLQDF